MDSALASRRQSSGGLLNRNVIARGNRTSMRLEAEFWDALKEVCRHEKIDVEEVIRRARQGREDGSRTSAVRAYLVTYFRTRGPVAGHRAIEG